MTGVGERERCMPFRCGRKCLFQVLLWAIPLVSLAAQFYYYGQLPDKLAVHFDALGRADAWASKQEYFLSNVTVLLGMAALFQIMISNLHKISPQFLNLPHKKFWLSEKRKEATMAYVLRYLLWIADLTILFLAGLSYQITLVNYYGTFRLSSVFWMMFTLYLSATVLLTVALLIRFLILPKSEKSR